MKKEGRWIQTGWVGSLLGDQVVHLAFEVLRAGAVFVGFADAHVEVAVSSSALFDLSDGEAVFREHGREAYRVWVREREDQPPPAGSAFPFVRRLLAINQRAGRELVEVVLISRNDPDTGLRVRSAIGHHGLPMRRAVFTGDRAPWPYIEAFGAQLFLSTSERDVADAMAAGHPAGLVLGRGDDAADDGELRIAFDFDGVLASDEGERLYREQGLEAYRSASDATCPWHWVRSNPCSMPWPRCRGPKPAWLPAMPPVVRWCAPPSSPPAPRRPTAGCSPPCAPGECGWTSPFSSAPPGPRGWKRP